MNPKPRIKILYLITKSNWGGAQRYVYDLATNLDRAKYEPVVALGGDGDLSTLLSSADIRVIKIDSLSRNISTKKEWAFIKELWSILKEEKPVVLHVNSSKAGGVGTFLGRLAGIPRVIFTAHGWAFNEDRPLWQKFIIKFLHWITVLLSHKTIAVSRSIVEQMSWLGTRRKFQIIHLGRSIGVMYDKEEARKNIVSLCPNLSNHLDQPWVMTIAELHPIKRINILIEAMKEVLTSHPNTTCVIIGDGQEKNKLETLINKNGLTSSVFLTGAIPEAARFLKAADVFVLPSKSESYGYVLHEAGLASVPVIATNVGGIPDVVTHDETGKLIPPDDSQSLTSELTDFLNHPKYWEQFSTNHHKAMSARTIQKMVDDTCRTYGTTKINP